MTETKQFIHNVSDDNFCFFFFVKKDNTQI